MTASMLSRSMRRHSRRSFGDQKKGPSLLQGLADLVPNELDKQQKDKDKNQGNKGGNGNSGDPSNGKGGGNHGQGGDAGSGSTIPLSSPPAPAPAPPPPAPAPAPAPAPSPPALVLAPPPLSTSSSPPSRSGASNNGNPGASGSPGSSQNTEAGNHDPRISTTTGNSQSDLNTTSTSAQRSGGPNADILPTVSATYTGDPSPSPSDVPPNSIPSATPAIDPAAAASRSSNRGAIAGGIVGALLFIFLAFGAWVVYKRRRKNRLPPSAEFVNNPSSYPFTRAGFGNVANTSEKSEPFGNYFGGVGAAGLGGQTKFQPPGEDIFSEKGPQMEQYQNNNSARPIPPPEVLYSTAQPASTTVAIKPTTGTSPGTLTTPNGRRIPFGTGTFQFPPRPH